MLGSDGSLAVWALGLGDPGHEELEVVVNLGDGADCGAGAFYVIALFDGDGGGDAFDEIDLGFVHAVEELPRVGAERFDVAALAFGVDGVEGEGGFSTAAGTGDDDEFAYRQVEIEAGEVVVSCTPNADAALFGQEGGWA